MTPRRRTAGYLALPLLLAACGGGGSGPSPTPSPTAAATTVAAVTQRPTAADLAERAGCTRAVDMPDRPLFILEAVDCLDPAWTIKSKYPDDFPDETVSFRVFGNNDGRDAWLKQAETFGDRGVIKGDLWAVEIPDGLPHLDTVAATIIGRIGGERVS